jgi:glucosamine-6-phosphate deaminase
MSEFTFRPSRWVPFRDKAELDKVRAITREEIEKHPNPDFHIRVVPDDFVETIWITDMFRRIQQGAEEGRRVVMVLPNPAHLYKKVAYMINQFRVDCSHLYTFNLDEYADEEGRIAPESYPQGFLRSTKNYFYREIDPELRPPEEQIVGPSNENLDVYGKMIEDLGGAEVCYSGPGWTGHLAFIEPDAPEFEGSLEEFKRMKARIVTLSPFTIAQNSLHGSFGLSGDMAAVPPRAVTVGPAEVLAAKNRIDFHALTTMGTRSSWQRFMTRLCLHGPVTPKVPTSILQTAPATVIVSETAAADIKPDWELGY